MTQLALDLDYRQTNERKLSSTPLATFQVYLEPGCVCMISRYLVGERERENRDLLINVRVA